VLIFVRAGSFAKHCTITRDSTIPQIADCLCLLVQDALGAV